MLPRRPGSQTRFRPEAPASSAAAPEGCGRRFTRFQGHTPVNIAIDFRNNAFVDGKWERAGGEAIAVINPATEEPIAEIA